MQSLEADVLCIAHLVSIQTQEATLRKLIRTLIPGAAAGAVILIVFTSSKSYAIPPFARKYQTSCQTCHLDFPKLNDFGKAFKDAGFKFPADDETYLKEAPVMLGARRE